MNKCFISHSVADRPYLEKEILHIFRAVRVDVWLCEHAITAGAQWEREVRAGLETSNWFVVVLSKQSAASEWVKNELSWAMEHRSGKILPLLIEDCRLDDFHLGLSRIQQIDFRSRQSAQEALIAFFVDANSPIRRGNVIQGIWKGKVSQAEFGPSRIPIEYAVSFELVIRKEHITGQMEITLPADIPVDDRTPRRMEFVVIGGFLFERYVQLTYKNKDQQVIQFGSLIGEVDDQGLGMSAQLLGYGALSKRIITGQVQLNKIAP